MITIGSLEDHLIIFRVSPEDHLRIIKGLLAVDKTTLKYYHSHHKSSEDHHIIFRGSSQNNGY